MKQSSVCCLFGRTFSAVLIVLGLSCPSAAASPAESLQKVDRQRSTATQDPTLPKGASKHWWSQVKKQIRQSEYQIDWREHPSLMGLSSAWHASSPAQGFQSYFTEKEIHISPMGKKRSSWIFGLSFHSFGRVPVIGKVRAVTPTVSGNRADYQRGSVQEWYVNTEKGLEQGFTINVRPAGNKGPLVIDLGMTGSLHPKFSGDGQSIDFWDTGNVSVLHYGSLKVADAVGTTLKARFEGASGCIRITVDDTKATYPISIYSLATSPSWTVSGSEDFSYFGTSVAVAGDVNGDGYSDVIVGAPSEDAGGANRGRAYVFLGSATGLATTAAWTASGDENNALFGSAVATAGDVNGDGYSDVIVGAYKHDAGYAGSNRGRAYVYHGSASGLSATADWTGSGTENSGYFGYAVATAGDANGDGYSDVLVGAYLEDGGGTNRGHVYLYHGSSSGLSLLASWVGTGNDDSVYFGKALSTAGDVNGDGYTDFIIGAPNHNGGGTVRGQSYVYLGSSGSPTLNRTLNGTETAGAFGASVCTAGDVNGDGYADVVVGAPLCNGGVTNGDRGKAFLFMGSSTGTSSTAAWIGVGDENLAQFGYCVATAGDVNGDGYADVYIGAPFYDDTGSDRGRVYLFPGSAAGLSTSADWIEDGSEDGAKLGYSLFTGGDVNGDGFSDLLAGAPYHDAGAGASANRGQVYLYEGSGNVPSTTAEWSIEGTQADDQFGFAIAAAGDVNGDGFSDVVVGAPYYDVGASDEGKVFVFHGSASGLSTVPAWYVAGIASGYLFGYSVAGAGDVDGDGYDDIAIGAPAYSGDLSGQGSVFVYRGSSAGITNEGVWQALGEQVDSQFGYAVAAAGDVNGDGYSDLIVGSPNFYSGGFPKGKVYTYEGSSWGLHETADWTKVPTTGEGMGTSLAGVGDVNRDGYSDVLIGLPVNGAARLFLGSASGLPSAYSAQFFDSDCADDDFGRVVAGAGDVNGDGYADMLVGAPGAHLTFLDQGRAYLFLGYTYFPSTTPDWMLEGTEYNARLGASVSGAGDVNGDGFGDVLVSIKSSGTPGVLRLYLGNASGLSSSPDWEATGESNGDLFGMAAAGAGDVNGDGFADFVTSAYSRDLPFVDAGKTYGYLGNGSAGSVVSPSQIRTDESAPISRLGKATGGELIHRILARTPFGRGDVKLEWQTLPINTAFDDSLSSQSRSTSWSDTGVTGVSLDETETLGGSDGAYCWRMRIVYSAVTTPFQRQSPWFTLNAWGQRQTVLRKSPACYPPDLPIEVSGASWDGAGSVTFTFYDVNESQAVTGFNVRLANDPSIEKASWTFVGQEEQDENSGTPGIQWTDSLGTPNPGVCVFYQFTSFNDNCPAEGPF